MVRRRTFVVGGMLTGCALSGLFAGILTAFATGKRAHPIVKTAPPPTASPVPATLQPTLTFSGHQQTVRAVAWSPDSTTVASGADDGLLLIWTPDGQIQRRIAHPDGVTALAWSPTGEHLASAAGTAVRFFDGHTAVQLAPARHAHTRQVTSLAWSSAPGHPLVSGALDQRAIVWNLPHFQPQGIFTHHTAALNALSCQPDGPAVASVSQGGTVRVWNVDTLTELHPAYLDASLPMRAVAFAPMGKLLAVGGNDGLVRLWSNGLFCQQSAVSAQGALCVDVPLRLHAHPSSVRSLSWSPDGHLLATGGGDGTLAIWAVTPGSVPTLVIKTTYAHPVEAVAWSPVGGQIAAASGATVTIWRVRS